jgi:hypothetical protein
MGQIDQAGAEAMIVAYECNPKSKFRALFDNGIKCHTYCAANIFKEHWRKEHPAVDEILTLPIVDIQKHPAWKALNTSIKNSDNEPMRYYYLGKKTIHGCVDSETEMLTKNGWVYVKNYNGIDEIAVWNTDNKVMFEKPSKWNVYDYTGYLHEYKNNIIEQFVTPNHKMVIQTNGNYKDKTSKELREYQYFNIPTSGLYEGGTSNISENDARLVVAIQADGCITSDNRVTFHFIRTRKIERIKELLTIGGYQFTERSNPIESFITVHKISKCIKWFNGEKVFDSWLLTWNRKALDAFVEELQFWDGTKSMNIDGSNRREEYISSIYQNVAWAKTIIHLTGKQSCVNSTYNKCFTASINRRMFTRYYGNEIVPKEYTGKVYCPTVSSGYFVIRRGRSISITGNSNYDMRGNTFVTSILEETDGLVNISPKTGDRFLELHHANHPEIRRDFHNGVVGEASANNCIIRNLFGYPIEFTGFWNDKTFREMYAAKPQSTVGCITNLAITEIMEDIFYDRIPHKEWGLDILQNGHDSILFQFWDDPAIEREVVIYIKPHIEREMISKYGEKFKMKSEVGTGWNWSGYDETDNPRGLKEYAFTV